MSKYNESVSVQGQDYSSVFVALFDTDVVWLNIQHSHGGAHCTLSMEAAKELLAHLKNIVGETE